ncbi:MAG: pyridoxamine 5'-phosphate oxidase family protein [Betaproteobacteria bacterium]|jgi:predicted pyridoxine 5'-phosphate oxidase superfamily flavin-nucleotide-binding protein
MSRLYGAQQRALQDRFDARRIADKLEALAIQPQLGDMDISFIESRDMFWLSTIDEQGRPTVSYKGGDPGFVKVVDNKTLVFPLYDGNGMFYSAGNIAGSRKVGLLFMSFDRPQRLRLQGEATLSERDPLMPSFKEALMLVRVAITEVWPNCPRYVHRMEKVTPSRYVPRRDSPTPLAGWKRIDLLQEDLPTKDQGRAAREGGLISIEDWFGKVAQGDPEA